jgi:hypothetical protein
LVRLAALALLAALAISVHEPFAKTVHGAEPNTLTPEQVAEGWINLFDGETLFGWQPTSDANWNVANGEIRVSAGNQGWLMTTSDFADYELHVEFKAPATTNSGVFLNTPLTPKDPSTDCFEFNIAPRDNPFPTGSFVGRVKVDYSAPAPGRTPETLDVWDGEWHNFEVTMARDVLRWTVDETPWAQPGVGFVLGTSPGDWPQRSTDRGRIGLQFREGEVAFRSIRLKPLGLAPMVVSEKLEGWRTDELRDSKFTLQKSSGSLSPEGRAGGRSGYQRSTPLPNPPPQGEGTGGY